MGKSVLQDWVMELPLREQGTLLTVIRGCDLAPKNPLDSIERKITGWFRHSILNPADAREVDVKGAFMQSELPKFKVSAVEQYPLHWITHVMFSFEVIGYRHPDKKKADRALDAYLTMVKGLHLNPETREQMIDRLSRDRIASGEIVS